MYSIQPMATNKNNYYNSVKVKPIKSNVTFKSLYMKPEELKVLEDQKFASIFVDAYDYLVKLGKRLDVSINPQKAEGASFEFEGGFGGGSGDFDFGHAEHVYVRISKAAPPPKYTPSSNNIFDKFDAWYKNNFKSYVVTYDNKASRDIYADDIFDSSDLIKILEKMEKESPKDYISTKKQLKKINSELLKAKQSGDKEEIAKLEVHKSNVIDLIKKEELEEEQQRHDVLYKRLGWNKDKTKKKIDKTQL